MARIKLYLIEYFSPAFKWEGVGSLPGQLPSIRYHGHQNLRTRRRSRR